jgi:hypothetical protein
MISKVSTFLGPNGLFQGGGIPSLVLSLDANNVLSYQGTSSIWYDLSVRKNNGLLNDVISITGSIPNTSLLFNGTSSYISFTQSNGIPLGTFSFYTIEAWFNSDSYEFSEQGAIVGWGTTGLTNSTNVLRLNGNGLYNYWWDNDLNAPFTGTSSMIVGNWYYAVATYDGINRKIYLNGELKSTDTPATYSVSDSSTLKIGHFYNSYFDGRISKVKISDRALSNSKILSNFNSDKINYGYVFGSMTFNDTDAYLISQSNDYVFGTNDFTIEAFFKTATSSNYNYSGVISQRRLGQFQPSINIQQPNTSEPLIEFCSGVGFLTYTASNNTWYHTAISRTGGTTSYYVNGELFSEVSDTTDYTIDTLVIGRYYTELSDYYFNGIISNVRVLNGTGLYTGAFSIPVVQLSATYSNTKLLITSQQTTPGADVSGLLHSVTSSNIGWTSSLPSITLYVTENLQFYVDAGLTESYSGTGTTWYDISGNSRNLTMDSLSYSSNNGGYIIFDGSHTADSVATYSINFSNGFTVESVAKFSGSEYEGLFAFNSPSDNDFINVQAQFGTNIRWEVESGQSFTSSNSLTSSTWYHFTCVYEGDSNDDTSGTARIYINGVENGTASLSANRLGQIQTSNFVLGEHYGSYLTGNIALSRMYNNVLTPIEVLQNFNATKNRFGL